MLQLADMLTEEIKQAFAQRNPIAVLTTIGADGMPNSVYVSCYGLAGDEILICDSAFAKTLANLKARPDKAAFLFWAPEVAAFQLKGSLRYVTDGPLFVEGSRHAKPDTPAKGIAVFTTIEAYKGATRLL